MKTVSVDKMDDEIADILKSYSADYTDAVNKTVKDVAAEGRKMAKAKARAYGWKDYGKDFGVIITKTTHGSEAHVQEKKRYQLTHLLENGHLKRGGGKTKAFPHIAPVQEECNKLLEEGIAKI